ncbi:MAG: chromate transporter [Acidobacteriota bacterium]|nr:chromate transporter [Acidobacteriota bacterium]
MTPPSIGPLTLLFLRIGNLTFGGGDPTMSAMQSELMAREWISAGKYGLIYGLARVTPGTNILAFCAGVGWHVLGLRGAMLAVLAVSLPSSALVVVMTAGYDVWKSNPLAMAAISGMLAAAVGMMVTGAFLLLKPQLRASRRARTLAIAAGALLLSLWAGLSPVPILALAAVAGLLWRA